MRAEAHGKLFARTAVQESAYGQRIEQVVALRGERADHTGKHITAAACCKNCCNTRMIHKCVCCLD